MVRDRPTDAPKAHEEARSTSRVAAPFVPAEEATIAGAVLFGFGLGWAMLTVLSARLTDQPQAWAAVPAAFMGLGGLLPLVFGSSVDPVLS